MDKRVASKQRSRDGQAGRFASGGGTDDPGRSDRAAERLTACDAATDQAAADEARLRYRHRGVAPVQPDEFDQPIEDAYELEFMWRVAATTADYLNVQLSAEDGPLSTKNYRIQVEAIPIDAKRSVIHMSYAYGYGFAARMAMQTYLVTLGRNKVGFSITGRNAEGQPVHVAGVLGLLERNTMRYYLAIDAYLSAYALPPGEQFERRIRDWYARTERYAPQLHEMDQAEYLDMKRKERRRQQQG